jgi:hypothetical protein
VIFHPRALIDATPFYRFYVCDEDWDMRGGRNMLSSLFELMLIGGTDIRELGRIEAEVGRLMAIRVEGWTWGKCQALQVVSISLADRLKRPP